MSFSDSDLSSQGGDYKNFRHVTRDRTSFPNFFPIVVLCCGDGQLLRLFVLSVFDGNAFLLLFDLREIF